MELSKFQDFFIENREFPAWVVNLGVLPVTVTSRYYRSVFHGRVGEGLWRLVD